MEAEAAPWLNGDENRLRLSDRFPVAGRRLETFYWEWHADRDTGYREWVRKMGKPISQEIGVNQKGLLGAATEAATIVQHELHERPSPLEAEDADEFWYWRRTYLNALIHLGGNRLAKEIEASVAPDGQPLTICLGSTNTSERVPTVRGPKRLYGYVGCLCIFPDLPYGRGRRWPRLCPKCEPQRSNAKAKAIRDLQRRVARSI